MLRKLCSCFFIPSYPRLIEVLNTQQPFKGKIERNSKRVLPVGQREEEIDQAVGGLAAEIDISVDLEVQDSDVTRAGFR